MTEDTTAAAAVARVLPGPEEIQAAVRTLMRAWAPSVPLPGDDAYGQDYDYEDRCGCAGENDDGQPLGCNCGNNCSCPSCEAFAWQLHKHCAAGTLSIGTHCGRAARYRVVVYRLTPTHITDSSEGAVCPHGEGEHCYCRPGHVILDAGLNPVVYQHLSACSVPHAQTLIARLETAYAEPADQVSRLRCRIEAWTYVPHWTQLPEHLAVLHESTRGARDYVDLAIRNLASSRDTGYWLTAVREDLARAAWGAAQPEQPDPADAEPADDLLGPVQEEPDELEDPGA